jgi:hypothetical protein
MQWMTPREYSAPWVSKSVDGRYAVAQPLMGAYGAYHDAGSNPTLIGEGSTMTEAQQVCEQHRTRNTPPTV